MGGKTKTVEELINQLRVDLKCDQFCALEIFSRMAVKLADLSTKDDIYQIIGAGLHELVRDSVVIVSSFEEASGVFRLRALLGASRHMDYITKIVGINPLGMSATINDEAKSGLKTGMIEKVPDGLYGLAMGSIPKSICVAIEKLLNVDEVYAIGFTWKGQLFGSANFLLRNGSNPINPELVKTFVSLSAIGLQRRQAEEALRVSIERKNVIKKLLESEEKYRLHFENVSDVIYTLDPEFKVLEVSPSVERVLGYKPKELIGKTLIDLGIIAPESTEAILSDAMRVLAGEHLELAEYQFIYKDGRKGFCEVSVAPIVREGKVVAAISVARDITERKKTEEALSTSEAKYRSLVETVVAGIGVIDIDSKFIFVNNALCHMMGYPREELLGKPFTSFTHPDDLAIINPKSMKTFTNTKAITESQTELDLEFRAICKDKSIIWLHTNPTAIIINGHKVGFSAILHNITDRKKAESKLQESYIMLQKSLRDTINAVAKMSEMRDPYTSGHQLLVAKLSTAIAREMNLPGDQVDYIGMAATIHDIGKVYVPSEILSKPGKLTDLEFQILKTHPQGSYDILKDIEFPWPIAQIVLQHHERLDGSGYPQGLKGKKILLEAKILAVADVIEAMASHRPYRSALGVEKALEEMTKNRGILYDETVVDACIRLFHEKQFTFE